MNLHDKMVVMRREADLLLRQMWGSVPHGPEHDNAEMVTMYRLHYFRLMTALHTLYMQIDELANDAPRPNDGEHIIDFTKERIKRLPKPSERKNPR